MLEVKDLTFSYPGAETPAVNGVSFAVSEGEIFGFLGPSGAGKTTVQKILNRQLAAAEGVVRYGGRLLAEWGNDYFEQIGVSFELPNLYDRLTGAENLSAMAALYKADSRSPAELFAAVDLGDALAKKASEFSKGMKQRLVFLRAIQHRPKMLFLDEPTGGNDPATTEKIIAVIRAEKARGATVLLTTHDMHVAEALCDRIAFIHEGSIVACDTPRNLRLEFGQRGIEVEFSEGDAIGREVVDGDSDAGRARLSELLASGSLQTIHSREASLGEIFIKLTGSELA
jgi:fluoroquinolone transport system ATP-binding protein